FVSGANDIGPGPTIAAVHGDVLVVGAPPRATRNPQVTVERTGPRATDVKLTCSTGSWDEDYGDYAYRWLREGAAVAGASTAPFQAPVSARGRTMPCGVVSPTPAGASARARSPAVLVPLPSSGPQGKVYKAGGGNEITPLNMLALSADHLDAL